MIMTMDTVSFLLFQASVIFMFFFSEVKGENQLTERSCFRVAYRNLTHRVRGPVLLLPLFFAYVTVLSLCVLALSTIIFHLLVRYTTDWVSIFQRAIPLDATLFAKPIHQT